MATVVAAVGCLEAATGTVQMGEVAGAEAHQPAAPEGPWAVVAAEAAEAAEAATTEGGRVVARRAAGPAERGRSAR